MHEHATALEGGAKLSEVARGATAVVRAVGGHPELRSRLQEMGFTPGSRVRVVARAPFGGPLAFQLRGSMVALRRSDAACVEI